VKKVPQVAVFRIRDILRPIQILRSVKCITDPDTDPALSVSDFQVFGLLPYFLWLRLHLASIQTKKTSR
jgi:hypothetical protein